MKSKASLHMGKQGDEAREFGLWGWHLGGLLDRRGKVLEYSGDWCNSRFKMDYITHGWSDFILMPRVGATGI